MSQAGFFEWLSVLVMIPVAVLTLLFLVVTLLYVYFDAERRTNSRLLAALLAIAIVMRYWPISFLAYLVCTAMLDRRRLTRRGTA